jgi:hypothetical protein
MEDPIIARYRWTADELLLATRYHDRVCRPAFRRAINAMFAGLLAVGVVGCFYENDLVYLVPVCGGIYWFGIRPFERRRMIRFRFARRPDKDQEIEWQFEPEGIRVSYANALSTCTWEHFAKAVRTPEGLLFYPTDLMFQWVPRRAFAGDAEFERVAELAQGKVQRFYEFRNSGLNRM